MITQLDELIIVLISVNVDLDLLTSFTHLHVTLLQSAHNDLFCSDFGEPQFSAKLQGLYLHRSSP